MLFTVLPSIGTGALSAREAEGRTNTSAGEKVSIFDCFYLLKLLVFFFFLNTWLFFIYKMVFLGSASFFDSYVISETII